MSAPNQNPIERLKELARLRKIADEAKARVAAAQEVPVVQLPENIVESVPSTVSCHTDSQLPTPTVPEVTATPVHPDFSNLSGIAKLKAIKAWKDSLNQVPLPQLKPTVVPAQLSQNLEPELYQGLDRYGKTITFNKQQSKFIRAASAGGSCCLIGSAGTGKTTTLQGMVASLMQSGRLGKLCSSWNQHKFLKAETPAIVFTSFTRRAVNNMRRSLPDNLKGNAISVHKFLQYAPVNVMVENKETGEVKESMRFLPTYSDTNPMWESIQIVVIEEASMLSVDLFEQLRSSLPAHVQYIFLGDINQLPPVFGSAILGYAMSYLPVIELDEVYRQALESPIIRLAHRILSGKPILPKEIPEWTFEGQLLINPWKKQLNSELACMTAGKFLTKMIDAGQLDFDEDIILCPYNKAFGTIELNKIIGNHLARRRGVDTYEILAGYELLYLSVGDRCMYDKEDCELVDIKVNAMFLGKAPKKPHATLDYWGCYQSDEKLDLEDDLDAFSLKDIDAILAQASSTEGIDKVNQASHTLTLRRYEDGHEFTISTAAEVNALDLAYALTIHKSQGCEWRKVILLMHQSHQTLAQRELIYTAVTRASKELLWICEPTQVSSAIINQRIKGTGLEEKIRLFKGKADKEVHDVVEIFKGIAK